MDGSVLRWESAGTQTGSWAIPAQRHTLPQALASKGAQMDWNKSLWKSDMQIRSGSLGQVAAKRNRAFLSPRNFPREGSERGCHTLPMAKLTSTSPTQLLTELLLLSGSLEYGALPLTLSLLGMSVLNSSCCRASTPCSTVWVLDLFGQAAKLGVIKLFLQRREVGR